MGGGPEDGPTLSKEAADVRPLASLFFHSYRVLHPYLKFRYVNSAKDGEKGVVVSA